MARFRALPLAELQQSDLVSNEDTGLYSKTAPAVLGAVNGFCSHSWQDDGSLQAQGIPAERLPLFVDEIAE